MYIPQKFGEEDREEIVRIIRGHPFATVVTTGAGGIAANHLPLLFEADDGGHGTLVGHMARANPPWKSFEAGGEVLTIFHGPHCYVSPNMYVTKVNVPTWNYVTIHAYGRAELVTEYNAVHDILARTIATFEASSPNPWKFDVPDDYKKGLIPHVVAFRIPIERLEAKFKLNQNRPDEDRRAVIQGLGELIDPASREMYEIMRRFDTREN